MPRESVYGSDDSGHAVKVGWSPQGCVQVGVGGPHEFRFTEPLPSGVTASYSDLWVSLDRHQINTLIRHLRKARDTAYGRDESLVAGPQHVQRPEQELAPGSAGVVDHSALRHEDHLPRLARPEHQPLGVAGSDLVPLGSLVLD